MARHDSPLQIASLSRQLLITFLPVVFECASNVRPVDFKEACRAFCMTVYCVLGWRCFRSALTKYRAAVDHAIEGWQADRVQATNWYFLNKQLQGSVGCLSLSGPRLFTVIMSFCWRCCFAHNNPACHSHRDRCLPTCHGLSQDLGKLGAQNWQL